MNPYLRGYNQYYQDQATAAPQPKQQNSSWLHYIPAALGGVAGHYMMDNDEFDSGHDFSNYMSGLFDRNTDWGERGYQASMALGRGAGALGGTALGYYGSKALGNLFG